MNWETIHKNIGNVIVGKKQKIIFKATDSLPEIRGLNSSCGCSIPKYDPENKILTVTYKPGSIPIHRQVEGWYTTTKEIISNL